mmetsp:Transcript_2224/g.4584  ORF Transcript_2224/g.4584 Transcript_2224/m.4584 type:complete len:169 (+) Transcript_2224:73-579(+)
MADVVQKSAEEPSVSKEEEIKAAKRAAILAKLNAAKEAASKEAASKEETKATHFGEHPGISCDGCGAKAPLIGYRYHCSKCANHDVCENCFDAWDNGKGIISNNLAEQKLSADPADHSFKVYKDKGFKALVKAGASGPTQASAKKLKPNDPCSCGSGKKYKKCCSAKE